MRELVLSCSETQAESLSDALLEAGVLAVSVEDADSDTNRESPLYGEPGLEPAVQAWRNNRVVALLPDGLDPQQVLEQISHELGHAPAEHDWSLREVPDEDWVRFTQSQFGPIQVGERIWIIPSWHSADPDLPVADAARDGEGVVRIQLDPGLAFGTGSHPTTHLCLEWLAHELPRGATVLDYGCGSGILAIAAGLLGAGDVLGVDIDDKAVEAARDNAARNRVTMRVQHSGEPLTETFDLVVANILTNPLCVLAPAIAARVAAGGRIALPGVLESQAGQVIEAWAPYLSLRVGATCEGWVRLEGERRRAGVR